KGSGKRLKRFNLNVSGGHTWIISTPGGGLFISSNVWL
ncbi:hypothetical protein D043_2818B, partial [Vibrio parahaemolyticus EKP-021]